MVYEYRILDTMGYEKHDKLNQLLHRLPEGHLADSFWLGQMGCYSSLRARYVKSGWLERVGRGVFRRPPHGLPGEKSGAPGWRHVVVSLQMVMGRPVWAGGRTALELHGFGHYVSSAGPQKIHLHCAEPAPGWLRKLRVQPPLALRGAHRLFPVRAAVNAVADFKHEAEIFNKPGAHPAASAANAGLTHLEIKESPWPLVLSAPERAALEMLEDVPKNETFHQADMLMEGLFNLRPKHLNRLLRECRSIKAKRLFLWFAERHNHAWFKYIDVDSVNLGGGKRALAPGGRLDPKYLITVPENLDARG
ncbi:MAG: type IV toxin-antitoxin system AbiEi family antitoxin domain-containing protein [Rhodospirillales bacterium]